MRVLMRRRRACDDTSVRPARCDLLVVSHAGVLAVNQQVYAELAARGMDVQLLVPARWRNEYRPDRFAAEVHPGLSGHVATVRTAMAGRPQRHLQLASVVRELRRWSPAVVFVEEEPFSLTAIRWARRARRLAVPYGVQVAETLDRHMPTTVRRAARTTIAGAAFVVARSPAAARLATAWGATGEVRVVAHGVEDVGARAVPTGTFTVGYVGRLVAEKGIEDLLAAARALGDEVQVVVAGDGPLAAAVRDGGPGVVALGPIAHDRIGEVYARAHVVCVPSRTTPSWQEQFGRVVPEALVRAVPVVATSTGELPWVLRTTGGGLLVPERDPDALATAIRTLARDADLAARLGAEGRAGVLASFTNEAAARELRGFVERATSR